MWRAKYTAVSIVFFVMLFQGCDTSQTQLDAARTDSGGGSTGSADINLKVPETSDPGDEFLVSWDPILNAVSYDVIISQDENCNVSFVTVNGVTSTEQSFTLEEEGNYYVCIVINYANGTSEFANKQGVLIGIVAGSEEGAAPTFAFTSAFDSDQVVSKGSAQTIAWTDSDSDDSATISLYYGAVTGSDCAGTGTLITSGISEDSAVDSYSWDTTSVAVGLYYICGSITDGDTQVDIWSTGRVSVTNITITSITRNEGYNGGGKLVILIGTGFQASDVISIGGVACTTQYFYHTTRAGCITGAYSGTGSVDVKIVGDNSSYALTAGGYTYCNGSCTNVCDTPANLAGTFANGASPWAICTGAQLANIAGETTTATFEFHDNIDLASYNTDNWVPTDIRDHYIDGQSYYVANLNYNNGVTNHFALLTNSDGATIDDINVIGFDITAAQYTATLMSILDVNTTTLMNCNLHDSTVVGTDYTGGVFTGRHNGSAGRNISIHDVTVRNTAVTGNSQVGLITSFTNYGSEIYNVDVEGTVNGVSNVGGVLGYASTSSGNVYNAVADVTVTGTGIRIGGAVGYPANANVYNVVVNGQVNCSGTCTSVGGALGVTSSNYSASNLIVNATVVAANSTNVGGIVGATSADSFVSGCIMNGDVTGSENTGGIVGAHIGTIDSCIMNGDVTGGLDTGGVIGQDPWSGVSWVYYTGFNGGTVTSTYAGTGRVGGFVGFSEDVDATYAYNYAKGTVTASSSNVVGGFFGEYRGTLSDAYSTAAVTGDDTVGGFGGNLVAANSVTDVFATGLVTSNSGAGGLIETNGGTVTTSYFDEDTTNVGDNGIGTNETTANMYLQATYTGFDFTNTWTAQAGDYPYLSWEREGLAFDRVEAACSGSGGSKTLVVYIMNPDATNDMVISSLTVNDAGTKSSDTCTGATLSGIGASCSFTMTYATTPTVTSNVDIDVDQDNTFFADFNIGASFVDNVCP